MKLADKEPFSYSAVVRATRVEFMAKPLVIYTHLTQCVLIGLTDRPEHSPIFFEGGPSLCRK